MDLESEGREDLENERGEISKMCARAQQKKFYASKLPHKSYELPKNKFFHRLM